MNLTRCRGQYVRCIIPKIGLLGFLLTVGFTLAFANETRPDSLMKSSGCTVDTSRYARNIQPLSSNFSGHLYRVIGMTGILLLILVIGVWGYSKVMQRGMFDPQQRTRILARQNIGPKHYLLLLRVERRKLLIGVTDKSIKLISDLGITEESEEDPEISGTGAAGIGSFATILKRFKRTSHD